MKPRTLFEKIWEAHVVKPETADTPAVLYVDLHLVHEVTSPQAFTWLREKNLKVRRPERTVATMDHSTPTTPRGRDGRIPVLDSAAATQIAALEKNCADFGIELHALGTKGQGIVHVIGPELGLTQPGAVIVCGDSHTCRAGRACRRARRGTRRSRPGASCRRTRARCSIARRSWTRRSWNR